MKKEYVLTRLCLLLSFFLPPPDHQVVHGGAGGGDKATTGVSLGDLLPFDVSSVISSATDAHGFINDYATAIGPCMDDLGVEHSDWKSIQPVDGVDGIDGAQGKLQEVAGPSYQGFAQFVTDRGFDAKLLDMRECRRGVSETCLAP